MSKYSEMCDAIAKKIKDGAREGSKPACVTSSSDLTAMTQAMLNSPDHVVHVYSKKGEENDTPSYIDRQPAKRYRESLKPTLKQLGLDRDEVNKIDDVSFSKEHAGAIMDLSTQVIKDYVNCGRRFVFPITDTNEAQMSLCKTDIDEKITKPNRFVKQADGRSVPEPTGKTVVTKAHTAMKVRNSVPFWLRTSTDTKE